jgi:hypothetical protein
LIVQCENPECRAPFDRVEGKRGRPRKYCSDRCRLHMLRTVYQPAYAKRQKLKSIGRNPWI